MNLGERLKTIILENKKKEKEQKEREERETWLKLDNEIRIFIEDVTQKITQDIESGKEPESYTIPDSWNLHLNQGATFKIHPNADAIATFFKWAEDNGLIGNITKIFDEKLSYFYLEVKVGG